MKGWLSLDIGPASDSSIRTNLKTVKYGPKEKIGVAFDGKGTLPAWPYSGWITR